MARRPRVFLPGLLYHVIARGNQRKPTFLVERDYEAYLDRLARYQRRYAVALYAYCLMPNHIHLLLETSEAPLAKFMQGLQQSYTQRFNRVHGQVGHVFQGRYRAIICERDEYLLTLIRYIHLNPVRAGLVRDPAAYRYSGHHAYLSNDGASVVDPGPVLRLLGGRAAYRRFVSAGIADGHEDRYYRTEEQQFLGGRGFAQQFGQPAPRAHAAPSRPVDIVIDDVARRLATTPSALRGPDRNPHICRVRAALSFALVRRLGYRVADVAAALGRDVSTISVLVSRVAGRIESGDRLGAAIARLARDV